MTRNKRRVATITTIKLTAADIREFVKAPKGAKVTIYVPGGGDWSCTDLQVSEKEDDDQCVRIEYAEEVEA